MIDLWGECEAGSSCNIKSKKQDKNENIDLDLVSSPQYSMSGKGFDSNTTQILIDEWIDIDNY